MSGNLTFLPYQEIYPFYNAKVKPYEYLTVSTQFHVKYINHLSEVIFFLFFFYTEQAVPSLFMVIVV